MKLSHTLKTTLLIAACACMGKLTHAQLGYSSAAMGMGKMNAKANLIPKANQVVVEEIINYHKHELPLPKQGDAVALDIDGYTEMNETIIVQLGLSTAFVKKLDDVPPVNVSLVIDRSGSMNGDRIEKAKEAAIEFVKRLREKDFLSVVLFDNQIDVLIEAQHVSNKEKLIAAIRSIEVGGSTDLNAGLIQGYTQVLKNHNSGQNNKVIMLTDAITNTGEIDPIRIIQGSNAYTAERQIDITMVGIGADFNNDLSRQIANSKHCSIFFINDSEDIKKVFIDEIESLLSPIAHDVKLRIELAPEVEIDHFFGYTPQINGNIITMDLENINSGLTQVILFKIKPKKGQVFDTRKPQIQAELTYTDMEQAKPVTVTASSSINLDKSKKEADIQKNYYIGRMAQCMLDMAQLYHNNNLEEAARRVQYILESTTAKYPVMEDQDIKRTYDMLAKYGTILQNELLPSATTSTFPY